MFLQFRVWSPRDSQERFDHVDSIGFGCVREPSAPPHLLLLSTLSSGYTQNLIPWPSAHLYRYNCLPRKPSRQLREVHLPGEVHWRLLLGQNLPAGSHVLLRNLQLSPRILWRLLWDWWAINSHLSEKWWLFRACYQHKHDGDALCSHFYWQYHPDND